MTIIPITLTLILILAWFVGGAYIMLECFPSLGFSVLSGWLDPRDNGYTEAVVAIALALILTGPITWLAFSIGCVNRFIRWIKDDLDDYHRMMDWYCHKRHD
jgi:hypothetical protein